MLSLPANLDVRQVSRFRGTCKACGSSNFIVRLEPPHRALRCGDCNAWQKWIRKGDAGRYHREAQPKLTSTPYLEITERIGPAVDAPNGKLAARVERLEKTIAGHDRELRIVLKAIWACGVLQPKGVAPELETEITDQQIAAFNRAIGDEG